MLRYRRTGESRRCCRQRSLTIAVISLSALRWLWVTELWLQSLGIVKCNPLSTLRTWGRPGLLHSVSAELPSGRFVWSLRLICTAALGISVYLAWTAFSMGNVFGCSGGDVIDCGHVLTSHWSKILGIPVSVPAAGLYASLIALLVFARRGGPKILRNLVWSGMTLGSVMAGLAALWFIGLQIFVLKHYCPYCLVVHTCGIVLACTMLTSPLCPAKVETEICRSQCAGYYGVGGQFRE